jgi:UDP-glucose 4-epimerase
MRILVTGSSGQLGAEICRQLMIDQHIVRGLDLRPGPYTTLHSSILDQDAVSEAVAGCEAILHVASLHAPHVPSLPKQAFVDVNITGTLNLLEAAARAMVKRFVYTSTTSIYGRALIPSDEAVWVTEELALEPRDIYDITKRTAEDLCQQFAIDHGLSAVCLRVSRFFPEPEPDALVYRLFRGVDVRDAATAHILAASTPDVVFDVFNISARSPFEPGDLPDLLHDAPSVLERRAPEVVSLLRERRWSIPHSIDRVYVIERAQQLLGYQPRYNAAEYARAASEMTKGGIVRRPQPVLPLHW